MCQKLVRENYQSEHPKTNNFVMCKTDVLNSLVEKPQLSD